jgi:CDP-diglyceride synthetase
MAHTTPLTKLEKRTALLLTIIGIMGSLFGIIAIAVPYFFLYTAGAMWCDQCAQRTINRQVDHTIGTTAIIIILSIVVSFLPRILYGARLRRARRDCAGSEQKNAVD